MTHHAVYRMVDADGALLYIGCTGNLPTRLDQHRAAKPWWADVSNITVEHYNSATDARRAESAAILDEKPLYNWLPAAVVARSHATRRRNRDAAHAAGHSCGDCKNCVPERYERIRERNALVRAQLAESVA